jgi:hypothetical protein
LLLDINADGMAALHSLSREAHRVGFVRRLQLSGESIYSLVDARAARFCRIDSNSRDFMV